MLEDKLTEDQRIRLEALNQATASLGPMPSDIIVLSVAKKFEKYIRDGEEL